jgi:hypothetical protein
LGRHEGEGMGFRSARLVGIMMLATAATACPSTGDDAEVWDGDSGPADGDSPDRSWEGVGACEDAVCAHVCREGDPTRTGSCVADRCVCDCDPVECGWRCGERDSFCDSAGNCVCTGCPFGDCSRDDAGGWYDSVEVSDGGDTELDGAGPDSPEGGDLDGLVD